MRERALFIRVAIITLGAIIGALFGIFWHMHGAEAGSMSRCTYVLPTAGLDSFVQRTSEVPEWLKRVKEDHSIPNWDGKEECHPADTVKESWHLMVKAYGGTVSLIKGITEDACFRMLEDLRPNCGGASSCSFPVGPGSFDTGECFE